MGRYLRGIANKSDELATKNELLDTTSIKSSYIDQLFIDLSGGIHMDPGRRRKNKKHKIESIVDNNDFIFIEGTMGTGKSKLISKLTSNYSISESFNATQTVPYVTTMLEFIEIFDGKISNIIDHINEQIPLEDIYYLIMIDAFDELKKSESDKVSLLEDIYKEVISNKLNCKVLVTSRPLNEPNIDNRIDKVFNRYGILPLTINQITNLIDIVCGGGEAKSKFIAELEKSQLLKVLPKTPISAIIIAKLLDSDIQEIPSTMTELYAKYTELVLGRWDIDKGLQSQNEYNVMLNVTIQLSKYMLENELGSVSTREVRAMFDEYIDSRKVSKINREGIFNKLIGNREVFKYNSSTMSISFVHRTFCEYFYANYLYKDHKAIIDEKIFSSYWNNSYFFYFGLVKDSTVLINALDNIQFTDEEYKFSKIFTNGNFLLAAYLTPYETIRKSIQKAYDDAALLYYNVSEEKTSSPLSALSKVHLLAIITQCMSSTYGYEFFIEALEDYSLHLSCIDNPNDEEYIKLFLVNSSLVANNKFTSFDMMIHNYGNKVPDILQIGIHHTLEEKSRTNIIKKYLKSFYKKRRRNLNFDNFITSLYDNPINENMAKDVKEHLSKS